MALGRMAVNCHSVAGVCCYCMARGGCGKRGCASAGAATGNLFELGFAKIASRARFINVHLKFPSTVAREFRISVVAAGTKARVKPAVMRFSEIYLTKRLGVEPATV